MNSINPYLALVGKEIICECVKHDKTSNPNFSTMIIRRPIKITFHHKSHRRTGKPCFAYVNSVVKYNLEPQLKRYVSTEVDINDILTKLKLKFAQDYIIYFNNKIYGKKLIGECSYSKSEDFSHMSATHGGQRIKMGCSQFVLCYVEHPHEYANMKVSAI